MSTPFLSSEEYDERAHRLYNEGRYEDALSVLREGLGLYPHAVGLHVGEGYARLAREEFAWARRSFEEARALDPDHEDALAGLGEVMLRVGRMEDARRLFARTIELGHQGDPDLMLQVGRALFREGLAEDALPYATWAADAAPESVDAVAFLGFVQHRLDKGDHAIATLRRALQLDASNTETRIYLANVLYDAGELEAALYHLDRTHPDDHWDELGIWRLIDLRRSIHQVPEDDAGLQPWFERLGELAGGGDDIDVLLAEVEAAVLDQEENSARNQLDLFGLPEPPTVPEPRELHRVVALDGRAFHGSWEEIVRQMRDGNRTFAARSVQDFMASEARRGFSLTGMVISTSTAESFIRDAADAGLLKILA